MLFANCCNFSKLYIQFNEGRGWRIVKSEDIDANTKMESILYCPRCGERLPVVELPKKKLSPKNIISGKDFKGIAGTSRYIKK